MNASAIPIPPNFDPLGLQPLRFADLASEQRLAQVHPLVAKRARLLNAFARKQSPAIVFRITQGLRTWEQQGALFDRGRSTPGLPCVHDGITRPVGTCQQHKLGAPVTNARPGQSWHNFGLAFDVAVATPQLSPIFVPDWNPAHPSWQLLIKLGGILGLDCGALWRSFPDDPHFELTGQLKMPGFPGEEVSDLYHRGGLKAVWDAAELV